MKGVDPLEIPQWSLASIIKYDHPFFTINTKTVIHTWIILLLLFMVLLPVKWILYHTRIGRFIILSFINSFADLTKQSLGYFSFAHFSFLASLFLFILACNIIPLIPWLEEPTSDLNTTLALGITSFMYTQSSGIMAHGFVRYIKKEFLSPFFLMFPLNLIGKLASIVSMSLRLFGNIFGGSIITRLYFSAIQGSILPEIIGIVSGVNILMVFFFTLFEGFLQAFVFTMLTLTYLAINVQKSKKE